MTQLLHQQRIALPVRFLQGFPVLTKVPSQAGQAPPSGETRAGGARRARSASTCFSKFSGVGATSPEWESPALSPLSLDRTLLLLYKKNEYSFSLRRDYEQPTD